MSAKLFTFVLAAMTEAREPVPPELPLPLERISLAALLPPRAPLPVPRPPLATREPRELPPLAPRSLLEPPLELVEPLERRCLASRVDSSETALCQDCVSKG